MDIGRLGKSEKNPYFRGFCEVIGYILDELCDGKWLRIAGAGVFGECKLRQLNYRRSTS